MSENMSEYVTVQEYARIKGVTERTAYRRIANGEVEVRIADGKKLIKIENYRNKNVGFLKSEIDSLKSENSHLKNDIEYLQIQLEQALRTTDEMRKEHDESLKRSDTIVLQLTQQVDKLTEQNQALTQQNQLLLEDLRPKKGFFRRLFAWNGG